MSKSLYNKNIELFTAMHWILSPEPQPLQPDVPLIEDVLMDKEYVQRTDAEKTTWLMRKLLVSDLTIKQVIGYTL